MYLVSNEEMRALDHAAIQEWHIPSLILMENAGIAIVRQLSEDVPDLLTKRITILCGRGNNGGTSALSGWCSACDGGRGHRWGASFFC